MLKNKKILLGVTGGVACYKSALIVRFLKLAGAEVRVILSKGAQSFVGPLTFQALSGYPVSLDILSPTEEASMSHISLARWADAVLIAPATAQCLAKLAHGVADDLLSTLCLATQAPIFVAPAMNHIMWSNQAVQANVVLLQSRGITILGPDEGVQACGEEGLGRMLEPECIQAELTAFFYPKLLQGKHVVITAGPTQEFIDPVRFISNASSGKMGYAIATAANYMGAKVTLISGPVALSAPRGVNVVKVIAANEMREVTLKEARHADVFIATAAVADYRPISKEKNKIKKKSEKMQVELILNEDILAEVANLPNKPYLCGFAAETDQPEMHARIKLAKKKLDLICVNDVSEPHKVFGSDENEVILITADTPQVKLDRLPKLIVAEKILQFIASKLFRA